MYSRLKCFLIWAVVLHFPVASNQQQCGDIDAESLVMTLTVFRHGDRTPSNTYPTDPYQRDFWKKWGGFNHLTQQGMEQLYERGKWFRSCYNNFLGDTYNPDDVYIRSTDYDRTLQSAASYLAGLYPPKDFQIWGSSPVGQSWQPIPTHTFPKSDDYTLIPGIYCPPYDKLQNEIWTSSLWIRTIESDNRDLLEYMGKNAGLKTPTSLYDVLGAMGDAIRVERLKNLTLPSWVNQTVQDKLEEWGTIWLTVSLANNQMIRWAAGDLVRNIKDTFISKSAGKIAQKAYVYSAHDSTVAALLGAYGAFENVTPPYGAAIINQLHLDKNSNRYYVRAFYATDPKNGTTVLTIRNCTEKCWLDDYVKVLEPFTLADKKAACNSDVQPTTLPTFTTTNNANIVSQMIIPFALPMSSSIIMLNF